MSTELWLVFYLMDWEELAAYTLRGTFAGEFAETRKLLAYQHGVREEDITAKIEQRTTNRKRPGRCYPARA